MICDYCRNTFEGNYVACRSCSMKYCDKCYPFVLPKGVETVETKEVDGELIETNRFDNKCCKCSPKRVYSKCHHCNKLHDVLNIQQKCYLCNHSYCSKCVNSEQHGLGACLIIVEEEEL